LQRAPTEFARDVSLPLVLTDEAAGTEKIDRGLRKTRRTRCLAACGSRVPQVTDLVSRGFGSSAGPRGVNSTGEHPEKLPAENCAGKENQATLPCGDTLRFARAPAWLANWRGWETGSAGAQPWPRNPCRHQARARDFIWFVLRRGVSALDCSHLGDGAIHQGSQESRKLHLFRSQGSCSRSYAARCVSSARSIWIRRGAKNLLRRTTRVTSTC